MNFIKKVQNKNFDDSVHLQFQKFSKGEFRNRALIEAKNSNGKYTIKTSAEFANELVKALAEKLGNNKTKVTGSIIGTNDLKGVLEFKKISQFQGVKNYSIEQDMSGSEIIKLINQFPKNFFALSFSVGEEVLKIKPKAPKSGKPGSKGEETPKVDFCSLKTTDKKIVESFILEGTEFKSAKVVHDFFINNIEIPPELKSSTDFALIREKSKRIGKILRKAEIDGKKIESYLELAA
ncbi:MAG TPA: hypothetical protein PKW70_02370 [Candidatus Pacearchaeota archaeon]|nr:hypothetical protein [Candidatus Pacearchaeota archaeon]